MRRAFRLVTILVLLAMLPLPALGNGCVFWSELIGTEYIDFCEDHAGLTIRFDEIMELKDERTAALRQLLDDCGAALDRICADWAQVSPEPAAVSDALQAFRSSLEMHELLFLGDEEAVLIWRIQVTISECARVCAMLGEEVS